MNSMHPKLNSTQKKTKILFMTGYYGVGGKERQLTEIIKNLSDEYEVSLMVKSVDAYYFDSIKSKLFKFINLEKKHFSLLNIFDVYKAFNVIKPDIVFSFSDIFAHYAFLLQLLKLHKFTLLNGSIRDAPVKKLFIHSVESNLYSFYKFVISNSLAGLKAYGQEKLPNRFVLYNGVDVSRFPQISKVQAREILGFPQDKYIVTMVANMTFLKDYPTYISVANLLKNDVRFSFYSVGDGPKRAEIEQQISDLDCSNVTLLGKRSDVELILTASDVSVLCSPNGEGLSNAILESIFCAKPVIATEGGGTGEIIITGENGYVVKRHDAPAIAQHLRTLIDSPVLYKKLSEGAQKTQERFSLKKMLSTFESIVDFALRS